MGLERSNDEGGLAPGTRIGDHFIVRRKLGDGGMGEVYLAANALLPDRQYAIKVLRANLSGTDRFMEMLGREAQKQAKFRHDNVVPVYDLILSDGRMCLIQDFIPGKSLAALLLEQPKGLKLATTLTLMTGVLDGLDHAHRAGILHCDVKPANVLVDAQGRPHVTDFGISRDLGTGANDGGVAGAGTPEYMAPEQLLPPFAFDHRVDVYAAGAMFFELLCGTVPFAIPPGLPAAAMPQLHQDAPDVRRFRADVPARVARIVTTALQRDPGLRFAGCSDFRRAIERYLRRVALMRLLKRLVPALLVVAVVGGIALQRWHRGVIDAAQAQDVREMLASATTARNLLCREWGNFRKMQIGQAQARANGDDDLVPAFAQRLKDLQANMDHLAANYNTALRQILADDMANVDAGFDALPATELRPPALVASMRSDVSDLRGGLSSVALATLQQRCPAPAPAPAAAPAKAR